MSNVFVEVLQADGGSRCAALNAASVALADAGIPMKDIVSACAVGKVEDNIVLDVNNEEDQAGQADMPVGYMPNLEKITLLQLDGILTPSEYEKCIDVAIQGCKIIYKIQKKGTYRQIFQRRYRMTIIDDLKKNKILGLLKNEKRIDGREFLEPRSIKIDIDLIQKANGSARVDLGSTSVIAGRENTT